MNDKYKDIVGPSIVAATTSEPLITCNSSTASKGKIGSIWTTMLMAIAQKSGRELDSNFVTQFIERLEPGAVAYYWDCKVTTWCFHLVPGGGALTAMGNRAVMNALFTYKFGESVTHLIEGNCFDCRNATQAAQDVLSLLCTTPTFDQVRGTIELTAA